MAIQRRGKKFTHRKRPDMAKNMPRAIKQELEQEKRIRRVEDKVVAINKRPELKYFDRLLNTSTIPIQGSLLLLNGIGQGFDQTSRIGGQVTMKSLIWRYTITSAADITTGLAYRMLIVIDRQANGANPIIAAPPITSGDAAILNNYIVSDLWTSPRQYETIKRFKILFDKTYTLNPMVNAGTLDQFQPVVKNVQGYLKLGQITKYDTVEVNNIGTINTNSLFIIHICNEVDSINIEGGTRLYFSDD